MPKKISENIGDPIVLDDPDIDTNLDKKRSMTGFLERVVEENWDVMWELYQSGDIRGFYGNIVSESLVRIVGLMRGAEKDSIKLAACMFLAEQASGKAVQKSLNLSMDIANLDPKELDAKIKSKLLDYPKLEKELKKEDK